MPPTENIPALVVAAGPSSRLGRPKQLIEINGQPLLRHTAHIALSAGCRPVVVVLGAYIEKIKPVVRPLPVVVLENKNWEKGMGTAIS
ncbi:MAG TPA: nucleotidyltransferase family protein, partial [Bacteroidetes bacterium]|nr:nucleotidyltransferase family protein [Bacteroidota bacterium]